MSNAEWFVVQTADLSPDQLVSACRLVMATIGPLAVRVECDLPWENEPGWSTDTSEAAARLRDRFVTPRQHADKYQQTGIVTLSEHPDAWSDFTLFVAEAYDATIWDTAGPIAEFADEGTSIVVKLPPHLLTTLRTHLAHIRFTRMPEPEPDTERRDGKRAGRTNS